MLPVLWNIVISAAWAKPLAIAAVFIIIVIRVIGYRAGGGMPSTPVEKAKDAGRKRPGFGEALLDDKWVIAGLFAMLAMVWRVGYLDQDIPLPIHTYGLMIATAFIVAIHLAQKEALRQGQDPERVSDLSFYILVASLIGSRIFFMLVNWRDYFTAETFYTTTKFGRIPRIFALTEGGLVFYGGFIGAAIISYWYMRRHKMPFFRYADTLIPSVAIGHSLGRIGCFAAGCCWGEVSHKTLAWLAKFPPASLAYQSFSDRPNAAELLTADRATTMPVHPTQLYESFGELAIFFLLVAYIRPRKRFHGQVLSSWLMCYAILRTVVELFRGDVERGVYLGLGSGQWVSIAIFLTGLTIWVVNRPRGAEKQGDSPTPSLA